MAANEGVTRQTPRWTRPGRVLPVLGQPPAERADAARSRRALLAAAREILAESGVAGLSMDCVAARAGVGVGTVYRRFGDRSGLAAALLSNQEERFQRAFIFGPPPLGPGAPPLERLHAFVDAYVDRLEMELDLHALAETQSPTTRFRSGAYQTHRRHLVTLLRAVELGDLDAEFAADALLALLGGGFFIHQHRERGLSLETIKANVHRLLERLTAGDSSAHS